LHYKYKIYYDKVWVAKQKVLERLFGSHKESFEMLSRLLLAKKESNPGMIAEWGHKGDFDVSTLVFGKDFMVI
jgi:hypothetical protein